MIFNPLTVLLVHEDKGGDTDRGKQKATKGHLTHSPAADKDGKAARRSSSNSSTNSEGAAVRAILQV